MNPYLQLRSGVIYEFVHFSGKSFAIVKMLKCWCFKLVRIKEICWTNSRFLSNILWKRRKKAVILRGGNSFILQLQKTAFYRRIIHFLRYVSDWVKGFCYGFTMGLRALN